MGVYYSHFPDGVTENRVRRGLLGDPEAQELGVGLRMNSYFLLHNPM